MSPIVLAVMRAAQERATALSIVQLEVMVCLAIGPSPLSHHPYPPALFVLRQLDLIRMTDGNFHLTWQGWAHLIYFSQMLKLFPHLPSEVRMVRNVTRLYDEEHPSLTLVINADKPGPHAQRL